MQEFIAALVVTLTLLVTPAGAETLEEIKQECEELESFWQHNPPNAGQYAIPDLANPAICFGYLQAIANLAGLATGAACHDPEPAFGPNCRHTLGICFPKGTTTSQVLAVFLAYARSHTAQWHEVGWPHFLSSLIAAFPCKGEYPATAPSR